MVRLSVRVRGRPGFRAGLRRVARGARAGASAASRESAERIAETMRRLVPIDTGELYDSIGVEEVDALTWQAVATAEHAAYVELGTARAAAQPFMVPAAELERREFAAQLGERVTEEVT